MMASFRTFKLVLKNNDESAKCEENNQMFFDYHVIVGRKGLAANKAE